MIYTKELLGIMDNLILVNRFKIDNHKQEPLHSHEFVELEYIVSGEGIQIIDGKEYTVKKGDLLIFDIGDSHSYYTNSQMEHFNCIFVPNVFEDNEEIDGNWKNAIRLEGGLKTPALIHFTGETIVQIERLLYTMKEQYDRTRYQYQGIMKTSLMLLLQLISQNEHSKLTAATPFVRVLTMITDNFNRNQDYSLNTIAGYLKYNPSYFSKYFKKNYGMTYSDFVARLRIERSLNLIMHTEDTIENICYKAGFSDKKQFYKSFKKYVGTTPHQLRKKYN